MNGRFTSFRWTLYRVHTDNASTEEVHLRDVLRERESAGACASSAARSAYWYGKPFRWTLHVISIDTLRRLDGRFTACMRVLPPRPDPPAFRRMIYDVSMDTLRCLYGWSTSSRWTLYGVHTDSPSTEEVHLRNALRERERGRVRLLRGQVRQPKKMPACTT